MDRGLIKINELKQKILEVQKSQTSNNIEIGNVIKAYKIIMKDISVFEEENANLNEEKRQSLEAPKQRKKEKKNLITSIILGYISCTLIALLVVVVGSAGTVSITQCLLSTLVLLATVCGIVIPTGFKNINKKYPITNNPNIEDQILSNNKYLEKAISKKNELDNALNNLRGKNAKLDEEISGLQKEIDNIESIRREVIEKFCNNNQELDKKLDDAYDKSKVKGKIK